MNRASKPYRAVKKMILLLLAIIYVVALSGFVINTEYCEGKPASVELEKASGKCHCHHEQHHRDCCKDVLKYFKVTDNQNPASGYKITKVNSFKFLSIFFLRDENSIHLLSSVAHSIVKPPPKTGDREIFLLNCNLLI